MPKEKYGVTDNMNSMEAPWHVYQKESDGKKYTEVTTIPSFI